MKHPFEELIGIADDGNGYVCVSRDVLHHIAGNRREKTGSYLVPGPSHDFNRIAAKRD